MRDKSSRNALHYACQNGHLEVVSVLIQAGADKNARDRYRRTPSTYARNNHYTDIVNYLNGLK